MARIDSNNNIYPFNNQSRNINARKSSLVEIYTNSSINNVNVVVGSLQGNFNWSLRADWEPVITGTQKFSLLQTTLQLEGNPAFASGIWKQRFFRGGDYLNLNMDLRIVDTHSTGYVAIAGALLASTMLPTQRGEFNITKAAKQALEATGEVLSPILELGDDFMNEVHKAQGIKGYASVLPNTIGTQVNKMIGNLTKNDGGVAPVRIKIGSYFDKTDMIIESVNATYSKEFVVNAQNEVIGPLWADFKITASTQSVESTDPEEFNHPGGGIGLLNTKGNNFKFVRNKPDEPKK